MPVVVDIPVVFIIALAVALVIANSDSPAVQFIASLAATIFPEIVAININVATVAVKLCLLEFPVMEDIASKTY